ncbi:MAG: GtrA family protein [Clostridiaceae bacterium]|jgi:putative flippase GtrA|nr:GtrA family protein [Clostridiaceae bacterium]
MKRLIEWLCTLPILKKLFTPESLAQFLRYIFVGVFCFTIEYTLFIILRNVMTIGEVLVNVIVYTIIFWLNFLLNRFFSFRSKSDFKRQLFLYGLLFFFNLVVGNVLLFSGIRSLLVLLSGEGSWPVLYLPKILIMFFIISWNFILYKKVIYK